MDEPTWFERIGPADAQQLATDVGPVPANVGALLLLQPAAPLDPADLASILASRLSAIPRMRQRLHVTPPGCGRPIWVDDPAFDAGSHVDILACPAPSDESALIAAAVEAVNQPLNRSRPMWRARILTGAAAGRIGVILVLHHVLADGMGGLALLSALVDSESAGSAPEVPTPTPRPVPTWGALFADAARSRGRALRRAPRAAAALGPALTELGRERTGRAPQCSLNSPTGPRRRVTVVTADLTPLRRAARDRGATVNDVLLVAAASAMGTVLDARGEDVPELVISVPISARSSATTERLGNQVGVMPVRVPIGGSRERALALVARATAARRTDRRGASAALVAPAFRLLAALGLFGPLIERQRLVNSFLTNMRGPERPLAIAGAAVLRIVPLTIATGNVSVAFAALSYASTLTVSVIVDPELVPELDDLAAALEDELRALTSGGQDVHAAARDHGSGDRTEPTRSPSTSP